VTNHFRKLALLVIIALACSATGRAQDQSASKAAAVTPLRVQVVLSKYQGDKKVSSLPYTLSVNSERGSRASLRMGAQVPIVVGTMPTPASADGKTATPLQSIQYKDVGTNIDCLAYPIDSDGRYKLEISIEDSSVYTVEGQNAMRPGDHPSFRSFRSSNTLLLKDGQTAQFTTATDKVNGEVMKADVTLNVVK
jgi:type II secretory pathway component GspD/PulD (secretin)